MEAAVAIVICGVLLVLSGLFSGSETAFTSLSPAQLHQLRLSGRTGRRVWRMCRRTSRLIVAILIGNNLANIGLSVVSTVLVLTWLKEQGLDPSTRLVELTVVLTFVVLIVAEITPKVLARSRPRFFSRLISLPLRLWVLLMWLPAALLEALARGVGRLVGVRGQLTDEQKSRIELATLIDMGRSEGLLGAYSHQFMHRIMRHGQRRLTDLFVHRTRTVYARIGQSPREMMELFGSHHLSRIPIVTDDLDNPLGVLHIRDLAPALLKEPEGDMDVRPMLKPSVFIPSAASVGHALAQLHQVGQHMAFVVDEHGGVEGIVTTKDLIEQITGTITDG